MIKVQWNLTIMVTHRTWQMWRDIEVAILPGLLFTIGNIFGLSKGDRTRDERKMWSHRTIY